MNDIYVNKVKIRAHTYVYISVVQADLQLLLTEAEFDNGLKRFNKFSKESSVLREEYPGRVPWGSHKEIEENLPTYKKR